MSVEFCGALCFVPVLLFGLLVAKFEQVVRSATRSMGLPVEVSENFEGYLL